MNYPEYDPLDFWEPQECLSCVDLEKKLDTIKDYMQGVNAILFGDVSFDKLKLERCVDEICFALDMPVHKGQIVVDGPRSKIWSMPTIDSLKEKTQ